GQLATKGNTAFDTTRHDFKRALRLPDGTHAVMNAARSEAALCNLETLPFAHDDVALRHTDILKAQFGFTARRMIGTEHDLIADDVDARRVTRDDDGGLLAVALCIRICLAIRSSSLHRGSMMPDIHHFRP